MSREPEQSTGLSDTSCVWIPLSEIREPGAYVTKQTGDLLRVPTGGTSSGDDELLEKDAHEALEVARLSPDPFIPITKARFAAAALDIEISF